LSNSIFDFCGERGWGKNKDMIIYQDNWTTLYNADCREALKLLPAESVNCVVTSPPYFGLRDYGTASWEGGSVECDHTTARSRGEDIKPSDKQGTSAGSRPNTQLNCRCGATRIDSQIGLEQTPDDYIANLVGVFKEVWRVLDNSGVVFLNLGDSYFAHNGSRGNTNSDGGDTLKGRDNKYQPAPKYKSGSMPLKPKDLIGIPWMAAFALRSEGFYLRSDIIWSKPNPMPESVTDRPTKAHEYIFLLSKSQTYYYNGDAIKEPASPASSSRASRGVGHSHKNLDVPGRTTHSLHKARANGEGYNSPEMRNKRSVWEITTRGYPDAHFATFPPELIKPCILAGCPVGGVVLDMFAGSGTTLQVAMEQGCKSVGIELNPEYCQLIKKRMSQPVMNFAEAI
jgi:DNA modification methylase